MSFPNNGLITETNRQYYAGSQGFQADGVTASFTFTFDTDLILGNALAWNPSIPEYALNNFKLYISVDGLIYTEYITAYTLNKNTITFPYDIDPGDVIVVQLKSLDGGMYGDKDAYGLTVEENYGSYAYISLNDIINNFLVAYVGSGKLIADVKRTDVIFHAKRGLQEFSYDTLKSVKSQELTIPPSLSLAIPQDYVNYVKMSWVDSSGVKHIIYPTTLTSNPTQLPIQDNLGIPIQSNFDDNIDGTSLTDERWKTQNNGIIVNNLNFIQGINGGYSYGDNYGRFGERYGLDPQYANANGSFTINERENKFSFSSDLVGSLIILEYISDGLAYDLDTKIPKMAEEAMYLHILYSILSTRSNVQEYIVQRFKRERSAMLRNTKIRLSNIKLEEITQVMRGKSKWIKH
ncbi:MAG: hypothetical protein ACOVK2_04325 [Candidatus Fonsibacter sp.]